MHQPSAHGTFANNAHRLFDNGYIPIPLRGKAPATRGWNKINGYTEKSLEQLCSQFGNCNVGILTGEVIGLDIDIMETVPAQEIEDLATDILGATNFHRIGRQPKRALLYRTDQPFPKSSIGDVEILGLGQQMAVFGTHPTTGKPYEWPLESILDAPIGQLPSVTNTKAQEFLRAAAIAQNISDTSSNIGRRNTDLFNELRKPARDMETYSELESLSVNINNKLSVPLLAREVDRTARQVWHYKETGRLMVSGEQSIVLPFGRKMVARMIEKGPGVNDLYNLLRATRKYSVFTIPQQATAKYCHWGVGKLRRVIDDLIQLGLLEIVWRDTKPGRKHPTKYRFKHGGGDVY